MSWSVSEPAVKLIDHADPANKTIDEVYVARINILRFMAMCSIVWGHCFITEGNAAYKSVPYIHLDSILEQIGKVGTINFFLISGFLLANKINGLNLGSYLRYRLFSIIVPWVIFLALFVTVQVFHLVLANPSDKFHLAELLTVLKNSWIYTAYWFVPVTILSGSLLVVFKQQLNKLWLVWALAIVSLFYSVNLYYGWISVHHTKAFLGFVFFFWLGVQGRNHFEWLKSFLDRLSWNLLGPLLLLFFILSCAEGMRLTALKCEDAYASTRISNVFLSILLCLSMLKFKRVQWIDGLKPQKYVYGVYLIHTILIFELKPFVLEMFDQHYLHGHVLVLLLIQISFFAFVFLASYLISILVKNSSLKFILGK